MKRVKNWFYRRFLPELCKQDLMDTNTHLVHVILELRQELDKKQAYINGMETALRRSTRVEIRNEAKP